MTYRLRTYNVDAMLLLYSYDWTALYPHACGNCFNNYIKFDAKSIKLNSSNV